MSLFDDYQKFKELEKKAQEGAKQDKWSRFAYYVMLTVLVPFVIGASVYAIQMGQYLAKLTTG